MISDSGGGGFGAFVLSCILQYTRTLARLPTEKNRDIGDCELQNSRNPKVFLLSGVPNLVSGRGKCIFHMKSLIGIHMKL